MQESNKLPLWLHGNVLPSMMATHWKDKVHVWWVIKAKTYATEYGERCRWDVKSQKTMFKAARQRRALKEHKEKGYMFEKYVLRKWLYVRLLPIGLVALFHSWTSLEVQFQAVFLLLPFCTTKVYISCTLHPTVFSPTSTTHIPISKILYLLPWQYASRSHSGSQNKWEKIWTCHNIFRLTQDWKEPLGKKSWNKEKSNILSLLAESNPVVQ